MRRVEASFNAVRNAPLSARALSWCGSRAHRVWPYPSRAQSRPAAGKAPSRKGHNRRIHPSPGGGSPRRNCGNCRPGNWNTPCSRKPGRGWILRCIPSRGTPMPAQRSRWQDRRRQLRSPHAFSSSAYSLILRGKSHRCGASRHARTRPAAVRSASCRCKLSASPARSIYGLSIFGAFPAEASGDFRPLLRLSRSPLQPLA
jgi:hypothetical protein